VDAVVIDDALKACGDLAKHIKSTNSNIQIVCLSPRIGAHERWADKTVSSHDPAALLKMLEGLGGRTDI
jgi:hypothetical protein